MTVAMIVVIVQAGQLIGDALAHRILCRRRGRQGAGAMTLLQMTTAGGGRGELNASPRPPPAGWSLS